jgi:hypothetical protein
MAYADALRLSSEVKELRKLMNYVSAKAVDLTTLAIATNASAETFLQVPSSIGTKQYWLRLQNDSARTWLEGGLGNVPYDETDLRVFIPNEASANGYYLAGHGAVQLSCNVTDEIPHVTLTWSS